jgi:hypothetical protein
MRHRISHVAANRIAVARKARVAPTTTPGAMSRLPTTEARRFVASSLARTSIGHGSIRVVSSGSGSPTSGDDAAGRPAADGNHPISVRISPSPMAARNCSADAPELFFFSGGTSPHTATAPSTSAA